MSHQLFKQHPTFHKYDRILLGLIIGLIVPFLGVLLVYLFGVLQHFAFDHQLIPLSVLLHSINSIGRLSSYLSVGCMLNLGVFYLFINRDYFNVARGIIFATILIAIPVVIQVLKNG